MDELIRYLLSILGATSQGFAWAILAIGVYVSFRILDFPDMTSEGSFALGGSISAFCISGLGINPVLCLLISTLAGMAAGAVTGFLHTKLRIPPILAGILTMIALYSVNLGIMGKSNTPLLAQKTILSMAKNLFPSAAALGIKDNLLQNLISMGLSIIFTVLVIVLLYWFLGTEVGCAIRATGNNEAMVRAQGANTDAMKIIGLMVGNGLIALSGGLVAQTQGFADVSMGVGAIVIGLASIVIGEVIFRRVISFASRLISIVIGSIIYRIIIASVLYIGFNSNNLKLLTAVMVAAALSIPVFKKDKVKIVREENEC